MNIFFSANLLDIYFYLFLLLLDKLDGYMKYGE